MVKILVTGANGQLGCEFFYLKNEYPEYEFVFATKNDFDITSSEDMEEFLRLKKIDIIINCAAYTNVEEAEKNKDLAFLINATSVRELAILSKKYNIRLIHFSTDYVFNGDETTPYKEEEKTQPLNVYGESKLKGEKFIEEIACEKAMIVRTSWLYSSFKNNFVKTMLKLGEIKENLNVIADQVGSPTYARDLADFVLQVIPKMKNTGVKTYHYSNKGSCSWFQFSKKIMVLGKVDCVIFPIGTKDYKQMAIRPKFSVLDCRNVQEDFGVEIRDWEAALKSCMFDLKKEEV